METFDRNIGNVEQAISEIMTKEGINPAHKGYSYMSDAIKLLLREKQRLNALTKEVYGPIAENNRTSVACVERTIRFAIQNSKNNKSAGVESYDIPTNKVFIAHLVREAEQRRGLVF